MSAIRVLVVEDSNVIRTVVRGQLVAAGHTVLEAEDGPAALASCRAEQPDVVLLDVEMPGMNGWQVLAAMKMDPFLADVPVVFLTGLRNTQDLVEGLRLGAHDYLRKPFEPAELLARVGAAARVKRLQDELRQRNDELESISRTDALTGLPNRRHIQEYLTKTAATARRRDEAMAVLVIDIDHFKWVNDRHGHAAGDAVLREVSARLDRRIRGEDMVGRWGGEEFLVVLPTTSASGAMVLAEQVRRVVAARAYPLPGDGTTKVTISLGCAAGQEAGAEALVRSADAALYDAKRTGRNRVVLADGGVLPQPPGGADREGNEAADQEEGDEPALAGNG